LSVRIFLYFPSSVNISVDAAVLGDFDESDIVAGDASYVSFSSLLLLLSAVSHNVRPLCVKMALICKNGVKVRVRVRVRVRDRIRVRVRVRVKARIMVSVSSMYR